MQEANQLPISLHLGRLLSLRESVEKVNALIWCHAVGTAHYKGLSLNDRAHYIDDNGGRLAKALSIFIDDLNEHFIFTPRWFGDGCA